MERNIEKKRAYWLCLKPEVYHVRKQRRTLLYNTETGICRQSENHEVATIFADLYSRNNPGCILMDGKQNHSNMVIAFVRECIDVGLVDAEPFVPNRESPVRLAPILNLQRDIDKMIQEPDRCLGEDVLCYLSDITLVINNDCNQNCKDCKAYCHQFAHCGQTISPITEMQIATLRLFFDQIRNIPLRKLLVTGGNIFLHSCWEKFVCFFKEKGICPTLGIHYKNIPDECFDLIQGFPLMVYVNVPMDERELTDVIRKLQTVEVCYQFSVASETEYNKIKHLIEKYSVDNYVIVPFFSGENISFFRDQVYIEENDILSDVIGQQMIFARQKMNTNFFGKMMILPNGDVKSNSKGCVLGNILHSHIARMIAKELVTTDYWRHTRCSYPCINCIYQYLCPSPSNYEIVIGVNNLCHVEN